MDWRHNGSLRPAPKKIREQIYAGKVRATKYWNQYCIFLIEYLSKGQTINAGYYTSLLEQLKDIFKEKHLGKFTKVVLFLHDNAPAHRALATQKKLDNLSF
jgi:hypothetical protein